MSVKEILKTYFVKIWRTTDAKLFSGERTVGTWINGAAKAITLVHNFPDHQPRGICLLCNDWIHPREWRIGAPHSPRPKNATDWIKKQAAYVVPAHKDYNRVMALESFADGGSIEAGAESQGKLPEVIEAERICEKATPAEIMKVWVQSQMDPHTAFIHLFSAKAKIAK